MTDDDFMVKALAQANKAFLLGEIPVGAVIVYNGQVIAEAHNLRETLCDVTAHAEIVALRTACEKKRSWRLENSTIYVTLEPCPMCAGAIVQARIKRLVYGASDFKAGACGSVLNVTGTAALPHQVEVTAGLFEDECKAILRRFFLEKREI